MNPSGLRIGTPALTTRGLVEDDMREIAEVISVALSDRFEAERDGALGAHAGADGALSALSAARPPPRPSRAGRIRSGRCIASSQTGRACSRLAPCGQPLGDPGRRPSVGCSPSDRRDSLIAPPGRAPRRARSAPRSSSPPRGCRSRRAPGSPSRPAALPDPLRELADGQLGQAGRRRPAACPRSASSAPCASSVVACAIVIQ